MSESQSPCERFVIQRALISYEHKDGFIEYTSDSSTSTATKTKEKVKGYLDSGWTYVKQNPKTSIAVGTGAVLIAAPAVATTPALAAAGFGAKGVMADSVAASTQSAVGPIAAKSVFATLTSAGAGGYGAAVVSGVVQAAGVATVGGAGVKARFFGGGGHSKGGDGGSSKGGGGGDEPEKYDLARRDNMDDNESEESNDDKDCEDSRCDTEDEKF